VSTAADADGGQGPPPPSLTIPEIRDYQKINAELVALLDRGHPLIRLEGAEGQRLLASGLSGPWKAIVEIIGRTGPEVAANLDAPGLTMIARGPTADGAARGLKSGRVVIVGDAGDAAGYAQSGGVLLIAGSTGHRAGLAQAGGILAIFGSTGRLACDRQSEGRLFLPIGPLGPHAGRGRRGGRLLDRPEMDRLGAQDAEAWRSILDLADGLIDVSSFPLR
jgi:methylamine---glutamate N-methyltransferase subunit B